MLLENHGIQALEEGEREKDLELMEWVFETRMEIEETDTIEELSAMLMSSEHDYDAKIEEIAGLFEAGKYEEVKGQLDQTQYLKRMCTEIELKMEQIKDQD